MGEVGDAAVLRDPRRRAGEVAPLALERFERVADPEGEHVPVALGGEHAVQLGTRQHEEAVRRRRVAPEPVVRDREHVVAGPLVVLDERPRRELSVRIRRMRVQRTPQPGPL